ncbi:hypothetical protein ACJJIX_00030 [Microbulbifer sp. VAAC004]|uniref:hypothetical protein n=1 Tax=unclassified Microbulbifer TaxID=2619833 RepID=UPI00403A5DCE
MMINDIECFDLEKLKWIMSSFGYRVASEEYQRWGWKLRFEDERDICLLILWESMDDFLQISYGRKYLSKGYSNFEDSLVIPARYQDFLGELQINQIVPSPKQQMNSEDISSYFNKILDFLLQTLPIVSSRCLEVINRVEEVSLKTYRLPLVRFDKTSGVE